MAPELIRDKTFGKKSDVWSFGVTIIEIFTRNVPFPELEGLQVAAKVAREEITIPQINQVSNFLSFLNNQVYLGTCKYK